MEKANDGLRLVAIFLLAFMIAVGVIIWLLDLIAQQQVFGLLAGAELVALALLVGLYYEEDPKNINRKWLSSGFAALIILLILAFALYVGVGLTSALAATMSVTLYADEISASSYGFAYTANAITSPGPPLTFKLGDIVNFTLVNNGDMPRNWALTDSNQTDASVLFNAQIGSDTNPHQTNQTGNVVFTVAKAGDFFYICQVPGHVQLGIWGKVTVTS
jgi:uncharacterized cupredoxin-like copper-binding protein